MTRFLISSDQLTVCRGKARLGRFLMEYYRRCHGGLTRCGDRFALAAGPNQELRFYLADAAGHGPEGARFWETVRKRFDERWGLFVEEPIAEDSIGVFARGLNDDLVREVDSGKSLCIAIGSIEDRGRLLFTICGYGVHLLACAPVDQWTISREASLGLKLGWIPSQGWGSIPGSFKIHRLDRVRRLVLFTDGFLGDDWENIEGTLEEVRRLGDLAGRIPPDELVPMFERMPHSEDDASVIVIDSSDDEGIRP